ncbi:hypothetical protein CPT_Seuss102 [Caulobacter phage Seuss]|uniref:PEP-utilising enzyme mobile domain-containing protein n=1 Tax=Caulobacter phage Seuss TaxID=1675601 RepID=A0A0K1LN35_9CAUD|nr:hypothetical protein HOR08_gp102 [Caulobacter phage Seuss]AKU43628.1 hypothetical protein CPT_Seuss102 [Caulobacter phage Seuss]
MSTSTSKTLHFSIDGEYITDLVRTRVREGRWDWSLKLLMEDLHGMTYDIALRILKGDAKLTGVNSLELADDDDQEYKRQLAWHFAGVYVASDGRFMRPYAIVTSWGPDDMVPEANGPRRNPKYIHNSLFYADDPVKDTHYVLNGDFKSHTRNCLMSRGNILFKEIRGFPHAFFEHAGLERPQEAIDNYLAAEHVPRLYERGYIKPDLDNVVIMATKAAPPRPASTLQKFLAAERAPKRSTDELRREIDNAAGDERFDMEVDGVIHSIPTRPFENWALNRTGWWHLAPKWDPICPQGLKMMGDDPYHSDWIIGGGFEPSDWHFAGDGPLNNAAYEAMEEVQKRYFNAKIPILSGSGKVEGRIAHIEPKGRLPDGCQVGVIKNAGPDYVYAAQDAIQRGAVLITEVGGAVAHLVTVFREQDLKIVRVEGALKKYPPNRWVRVDLTAGTIELTDRNAPMRLSDGTVLETQNYDD